MLLVNVPIPEIVQAAVPFVRTSLRLANVLDSISDNRLVELATPGAVYSESTLRKHIWVIQLYEAFSARARIRPWPLKAENVGWFVRFLGLEAKYAYGSISDVIVPSMKRINLQKTQLQISREVEKSFKDALSEVRRSKSQLKGSEGKEPAIVSDVELIINLTPDGVVTKSAEACLWLTSLSTGARAVTCFHVQVGDIVKVIKKSDSDLLLVQILFRVTKGNWNWNHTITLEGDPDDNHSLNVVYWLKTHLKDNFDLDLLDIENWDEYSKSVKLWPWSKDAMRLMFKTRAESAGFPYHLFSFHSLRAGFLCSALLNAGTDSDAIKAVLEHTAFVAGWVPYKPAQMRYVKESAKRTIVTSRLVLPKEYLKSSNNNIIDKCLTTSQNFHNVKLNESSWSEETNYKMFHKKVDTVFSVNGLNTHEKSSLRSKCWKKAFNSYVLSNPKLEKEATKLYESDHHWSISQTRWTAEAKARGKVGRKHIASILHADFGKLKSLVKSFTSLVKDDWNLVNSIRLHRSNPAPKSVVKRSRHKDSGHRVRILWSPEEDKIVVNGKKAGNSWVSISARLVSERSNVDCKDRYRNLRKKFTSDEALFINFE